MESDVLLAKYNTVEGLFSKARSVISDFRKRMSPVPFEALLFLKMNREFQDIQTVAIYKETILLNGHGDDLGFAF